MVLRRDEVPKLRLGQYGRLGWTTWLLPRPARTDAADLFLDAGRRQPRPHHRRCLRPTRTTGPAMTEISRTALFGKLNPLAYRAVEGATVFCKLRGNPYVELVHWLHQVLQTPDSDLRRIVRQFDIEPSRLAADLTAALDRLPRGATSIQDFSPLIEDTIERAWVFATLMFGVQQVRTAHLLLGMLRTTPLRNAPVRHLPPMGTRFAGRPVRRHPDRAEGLPRSRPARHGQRRRAR